MSSGQLDGTRGDESSGDGGGLGNSLQLGQFLTVMARMADELAGINRSLAAIASDKPPEDPATSKRLTRADKIARALKALEAFGRTVPTWDQLAEATGIPASTLHGIDEVRNAREAIAAHTRAELKPKPSKFDAWEDKDLE